MKLTTIIHWRSSWSSSLAHRRTETATYILYAFIKTAASSFIVRKGSFVITFNKYTALRDIHGCSLIILTMLCVPVPPSIVDRETSTDMVVRESANVTLTCKATGYPEPYVMWRREDGKDINYNGENGKFTWKWLIWDQYILRHLVY